MGQQPFDGDRARCRVVVLDVEPVQMLRHRIVEVHLALVAQLQHADRGEELGDRADGVHRRRGRGFLPLHVRIPVALRPHELLVVDHRGGRRRGCRRRPAPHPSTRPAGAGLRRRPDPRRAIAARAARGAASRKSASAAAPARIRDAGRSGMGVVFIRRSVPMGRGQVHAGWPGWLLPRREVVAWWLVVTTVASFAISSTGATWIPAGRSGTAASRLRPPAGARSCRCIARWC